MKLEKKPVVIRNMDKIIMLGSAHQFVIPEEREITRGSSFLYEKEHKLQNVLLEAYAEMAFIVNQYQQAHEYLLENGTPELDTYIKEINETRPPTVANFIIELHAFDLSTYFKSFLLLARAVLDKVVPLYSYRFFDTLDTFGDKGQRFLKRVKKNKHVENKEGFVMLVEKAKVAWLDSLITLRDEYAHYSSLKEYTNFWIPGEWGGKRKISGIRDFNRPTIHISGEEIDALEYMLSIKVEIIAFLQAFLLLCQFTPDRRPKHYLSCEECGFAFARKSKNGRLILSTPDIKVQVKDRARDYGVIICTKCGGKTDTDLQFLEASGLSSAPIE